MVDIEALLKPISEEQPSGTYLKLDRSAYRTLRNHYNTAQSSFRQLIETPDASSDEALIDTNQNNWDLLRTSTFDALVSQTKDTEFLGWYIASQLFTSAPYENLASSTKVLVGFVESFWTTLNPHPPIEKLKSSEEADQTKELIEFRTKPLLQLVGESQDSTALYMPLQMIGLIDELSFGDFLRAERAGTIADLKGRAQSLFSKEVEDTLNALSESYQNFDEAEKRIAKECQSAGVAPVSFKFVKANLADLINAIQYLVGDKFTRWPLDSEYKQAVDEAATESIAVPQPSNSLEAPQSESITSDTVIEQPATQSQVQQAIQATNEQPVNIATGVITNRDQAFHELRKISEFFQQTEPHSPIPFLLERAIRWGYMSLPELLNEMTGGNSGVIAHINQISGMDNLAQTDLSNRPMSSTQTLSSASVLAQAGAHVPSPQTSAPSEPVTTSEQNTQPEANTTQPESGISNFEW
ncbi:type VI secretion system ImpA family N-terminal domain-containing protein [Vibrio sp. Isolate23]|uniref:type VI secretion system protein TssA n=1 Tax=Vibrio sp. Isolate23 TaxID=2908533 RepID=UPI001EFDA881|nr:type VI secretion system ImpA family N-terminal domain-containing protein [Vibrio sp. Isolate23]MCG9682408.1 type VI secretion system ImpA family N-terminal domain-containing protein [Vibrio sp. Isolate23]